MVVIRFPSASVRLCLPIPSFPILSFPSHSFPPAPCPFLPLRSLSLSSLHVPPVPSFLLPFPSLLVSSFRSLPFPFLPVPVTPLPCALLSLPFSRSSSPFSLPLCLSLTVVFFPHCPGLPFFSLAFPSSTCASLSVYFPSCPHNVIRLHYIHFLSVRCFLPASLNPYVLVLPCLLCNIHPIAPLPGSSRCLCHMFIVLVHLALPWSGFPR